MSRKELDELQQQIPLLDYLEAHDWRPVRRLSRGRWMGLCPLHDDHQPTFLMDPGKNLFYCYGCGRGGDVIRFALTLPHLMSAALTPARQEPTGSQFQGVLVQAAPFHVFATVTPCKRESRGDLLV